MNTTLYTKLDIARITLNPMPLPEDLREKVARRLTKLNEAVFHANSLKNGIHYNYLGYNRYQIL